MRKNTYGKVIDMRHNNHLEPTILVIFGAGGDLTWRKLVPALYNLLLDNSLPEQCAIIGVARKSPDDETFKKRLRDGVDKFSRRKTVEEATWQRFADSISYVSEDLGDPASGAAIKQRLGEIEEQWGVRANRVYYLAVPPDIMEPAASMLQRMGVCKDCQRDRLVVEKPFGRDLPTARELDRLLTGMFAESQIYRIDHYLGKETVQNILAFRFANALFEPTWNRRYIDHIQITVAETVGVGHRGGYYDHAGALRDMVQNHLLQILCLIAMEPPVSFDANEVRNKKLDVLRAIRPILPEKVHQVAVRGQYGAGLVGGKPVSAYRDEPSVPADSSTETFAALKLFIDNWRWEGVPFYLRTGKRLHTKVSEVAIFFRPAPHHPFPSSAVESWQPNRLIIRIQPEEGIISRIQAKQPGTHMLLGSVDMPFLYREAFKTLTPEAYETLLLDIMRGDATLFMRADQVESAWSIITPILEAWDSVPPSDFPDYQPGSWGPEAADLLIARDGHSWMQPTIQTEKEEEK